MICDSFKTILVANRYPVIIDADVDVEWAYLQANGKGYIQLSKYLGRNNGKIMREISYLHRYIMGLQKGDSRTVDHINFDRLDNRRSNLRVCTHAENLSHSRGKGALMTKNGKWMAYGRLDGVMKNLGLYGSEQEAVGVANAFKIKHRGVFAVPYLMNESA